MPKVNVEKYELAQSRIGAGQWVVDANAGIIRDATGRRMGGVTAQGYIRIGLDLGGRRSTTVMAHRVIFESQHSVLPPDIEINHINGLKYDNRIENLEPVTRSGNMRHAVRTGLKQASRGSRNGRSKLTEAQVLDIKMRLQVGEPTRTLAAAAGVDKSVILDIKHGRCWTHVMADVPNR
jgi:hypothetical protein